MNEEIKEDATLEYIIFLRARITELRIQNKVSEHRMSLDLGKSDSYIRGITSGSSLPSIKEFLNICNYFGITPSEFFATANKKSLRTNLHEKLRSLDSEDLEKVQLFISWIEK